MNPVWHFVDGVPQVGPLTIGTAAVTSTVPFVFSGGSVLDGITTANAIDQRNGTTAQVFRLYKTYAAAGVDYERMALQSDANSFYISNEIGGTGTARNLTFTNATTKNITLQVGASTLIFNDASGLTSSLKVAGIAGITSAGLTGVPVVVAVGRVTAQSAANASISTFTVGAADASFEVSANMNVTASTTLTTTLTCTYTDESNTARSMILPIAPLSGTFTAAGAITGAGATVWHTPVMHIRCKAATAITILTSAGTFTGVTYTAEGVIKQVK